MNKESDIVSRSSSLPKPPVVLIFCKFRRISIQANRKKILARLYSSVAERQSCKLNVPGSITSGACSGPRETSRRKRGKPRRRQDRQVDRRDPGKAKRCKTAQKKHTAQTKNAAGKSETAQKRAKKRAAQIKKTGARENGAGA